MVQAKVLLGSLALISLLPLGCAGLESVDTGDDDMNDMPPSEDPPVPDDGRYKVGLQALYKFDTEGTTIADTSGAAIPLDLYVSDPLAVTWLPGGGLQIVTPTLLNPLSAPTGIMTACQGSNALTLEAWVRPGNLNQTNARILTYSGNAGNRNFTLDQNTSSVTARVRSTGTDAAANPAATSGVVSLTGQDVHVVYAVDPIGGVLYVDGKVESTQVNGGSFSNWDANYLLAVGNEVGPDERPWLGTLYLLAVYCSKLDVNAVAQNYAAGY